ncbi:hypothetical protein LCGC14_2640000, partial [marine sediment metagenome]
VKTPASLMVDAKSMNGAADVGVLAAIPPPDSSFSSQNSGWSSPWISLSTYSLRYCPAPF